MVPVIRGAILVPVDLGGLCEVEDDDLVLVGDEAVDRDLRERGIEQRDLQFQLRVEEAQRFFAAIPGDGRQARILDERREVRVGGNGERQRVVVDERVVLCVGSSVLHVRTV